MSHIIKNFDALARTPVRADALCIVEAGYRAIDTETAIRRFVVCDGEELRVGEKAFALGSFKNIYIVGCGKVAVRAGEVLADILGDKLSGGAVIGVVQAHSDVLSFYTGTHPTPSEQNFKAAAHIARIGEEVTEDDLVIAVIGGGGSALLCASQAECDQSARLYQAFLNSGGFIEELNIVRKHLSPLKGGGLAEILFPATVVGLIFSDVPGSMPSAVASGPTYYDASTVADAEKIIKKYTLGDYALTETPKDSKYFERVRNMEVVSSATAVEAMLSEAEARGYAPILSACDAYAPVDEVVRCMVGESYSQSAVVLGCEPRLVIPQGCSGEGGRMSYLALEALELMNKNQVCVAVSSDGRDNSAYAGAIADEETRNALRGLSITTETYKACRDSNPIFRYTDDLLDTGVLESNVSDLVLLLTPHA